MNKRILNFARLKKPTAPYNNVATAQGKLIFVATQPSINWKTGEFLDGDICFQTRKSLENVKMFLEESESSLENVVKVGIFLQDLKDFDAMNEIYKEFFPNEKEQPVRFTLQTAFPNPKIKVEFEAIAVPKHLSFPWFQKILH